MGVEVTWGNFLKKFMGCIHIKYIWILDGMVGEYVNILDEVLGTLELWCR